jgi:hypothetical protein
VAFPIGRLLALRPGIAWVEKRAETSVQDVTARLAIQCFQLAALAQVSIPSSGWVEAHGIVGPVVGLQTKCELVVWDSHGRGSAECDSRLFQGAFPTTSSDAGLLVGAGVTLAPHDPLSFLLERAYELGLTSIVARSESLDIEYPSITNRSIGLRAGLLFAL